MLVFVVQGRSGAGRKCEEICLERKVEGLDHTQDRQTHTSMHITIVPGMGQVHLDEVVVFQPQRGRPLMSNRGSATGIGKRQGLDNVRSPWSMSRGNFMLEELVRMLDTHVDAAL